MNEEKSGTFWPVREAATPDITISVIDTNNCDVTLQCLRSVFANTHRASLEVFVVDNACTDGSAEAIAAAFAQVKQIHNVHRQGFSTNNNLAFSQASGRYLLMLNDDTLVQEGALDRMVSFMDQHPDAGVVGARLLNPDGSHQPDCSYLPHPLYDAIEPLSLWLRPLHCDAQCATVIGRVCGACMMVRRTVADKVGLLDTAFDPLYCEEVDWCYRIGQAGWQVYHLPDAQVVHFGGQTMNRAPLYKLEMFYRKKALFFRKHFGARTAWTFKLGLLTATAVKLLTWALMYPFRRQRASARIAAHRHILGKVLSF